MGAPTGTRQGSRATSPPPRPSRAESAESDDRARAKERLELNRLVEQWGEIVAGVRRDRSAVLAAALDRAMPLAVSARGEVTLEPEELFAPETLDS